MALPVFSLRSNEGLGVGEFLDIKLIVDWAAKTGQSITILTLLRVILVWPCKILFKFFPLTTPLYLRTSGILIHTGNQTYKFIYELFLLTHCSAVSVFALHPLYIRIGAITNDKDILKEVEEKRTKLNALKQIDYVVSFFLNNSIITHHQYLIKFIGSDEHQDSFVATYFREGQGFSWQWCRLQEIRWAKQRVACSLCCIRTFLFLFIIFLRPVFIIFDMSYIFCQFRDEFGTSDHSRWTGHETVTKAQIAELTSPNSKFYKNIQYSYWVQYHLHNQLLEASQYPWIVSEHITQFLLMLQDMPSPSALVWREISPSVLTDKVWTLGWALTCSEWTCPLELLLMPFVCSLLNAEKPS